jgi:hypothetical protein
MRPKRPSFWRFDGTAEEIEVVRTLDSNLGSLERFVEEFEAALALFTEAGTITLTRPRERASRYGHWRFIAARDASMTIYHFGKVRSTIPGLVTKVPAIDDKADKQLLGESGSLFETEFPDWAGVRKGIAHRGDFTKSPKRIDEHRTDENFGNLVVNSKQMFFAQTLYNNTFTMSVEGKFRKLDMTAETLA